VDSQPVQGLGVTLGGKAEHMRIEDGNESAGTTDTTAGIDTGLTSPSSLNDVGEGFKGMTLVDEHNTHTQPVAGA